MPYLEDWHNKYSDKGFTLIGVHSPEFDFEREPENVRWATEHYGVRYPVVLDNHFRIWHAYANAYWPRKYLVLNGKIIFDHIGEGAYRETELTVRNVLQNLNPSINLTAIPVVEEKTPVCRTPTEESYCGFSRGYINNPGGLQERQVFRYTDPGSYGKTGLYLEGSWRSDRQYLEHVGSDPKDYLVLRFNAVSVNLVMDPAASSSAQLTVSFNDMPLVDEKSGDDVVQSHVTLSNPKMYNLFRAGDFVSGTLKLTDLPDGLRLYAFSFGGCIGVL